MQHRCRQSAARPQLSEGARLPEFTIVIANRNYSSWSLRGWLALKQTGAEFDEVVIPLDQPTTRADILKHSPSARVPALRHGELVVWDSLAICEYLAERFPEAKLWPADPAPRAVARSVSAEMHSGFQALRQHFPMNMRSTFANRGTTPEVQADVNRILALWRDARRRFGAAGPFLFGEFSAADCMYAPVVSRFRTYKVELDDEARAYVDAVWATPAMQEWVAAATNEPMIIEKYEF
jgi:glutathione S-transferase